MRRYIEEHIYLLGALALVGTGLVASAMQEFSSAISGILVQVRLCGEKEYSCIAMSWGIIIVIVICIGWGLDLRQKRQKRVIEDQPVFRLIAHPPLEKNAEEFRWASINVENISSSIISQCFVMLDDLLDMNGKSVLVVKRKRQLLWSNGDPPRNQEKDISPGEQKVIDVATTSPSNNQLTTEVQNGAETKGKGVYEAIITAHGRLNGQARRNTERFIIEYTGKNVLTIINKGHDQWTNRNPKKTTSRKRKTLPEISGRSST